MPPPPPLFSHAGSAICAGRKIQATSPRVQCARVPSPSVKAAVKARVVAAARAGANVAAGVASDCIIHESLGEKGVAASATSWRDVSLYQVALTYQVALMGTNTTFQKVKQALTGTVARVNEYSSTEYN